MRNVLVTGGSRGLGLAIASQLAGAGYRVIAVARKSSDELSAASHAAADAGIGAIEYRALDFPILPAFPPSSAPCAPPSDPSMVW
jgi:3-oxoacyl-[acyl-carrier protein] reductase